MKNTYTSVLDSLQSADLDAGQVFSGKSSGTTVRGYATPSAYTPALDHEYIFHESSRDIAVWFVASAVAWCNEGFPQCCASRIGARRSILPCCHAFAHFVSLQKSSGFLFELFLGVARLR